MAKGGSGPAAVVWKARRSALNSVAPWLEPEWAQARVLGIQRKLHRWAGDDQDRRFQNLHNLVCDSSTLMVAWQRVRADRGSRSAGVDRQNAYDFERPISEGIHATGAALLSAPAVLTGPDESRVGAAPRLAWSLRSRGRAHRSPT